MSKSKYVISEFNLVGQLVDIVINLDNKVKYLKLATDHREYWFKASKQISNNLGEIPQLGAKVQIQGERKQSWKKGKVKYKAQAIKLVDEQETQNSMPSELGTNTLNQPETQTTSFKQPKAKILVCKKSTCWEKGGKEVCALLKETICDRGLSDQVEIKTTGCLKQCKKGPNIIMMPDKANYTKVQPQQVPHLINKHLINATN